MEGPPRAAKALAPQITGGSILPMDGPRRAYDLLRGYVNREWERIQNVEDNYAEQELRKAMEVPATVSPLEPARLEPTENNIEFARKLLGVTAESSFTDIRREFERLNKRSDPANFPAGSYEARQASEIQKRVLWAYSVLTEGMDTTEKRFRSLEID